jgi:hypothetical protein
MKRHRHRVPSPARAPSERPSLEGLPRDLQMHLVDLRQRFEVLEFVHGRECRKEAPARAVGKSPEATPRGARGADEGHSVSLHTAR